MPYMCNTNETMGFVVQVVLVSGVSAVPVDETCTTQLRVDAEDRKEWFPDISKIEVNDFYSFFGVTLIAGGGPLHRGGGNSRVPAVR